MGVGVVAKVADRGPDVGGRPGDKGPTQPQGTVSKPCHCYPFFPSSA